MSPLAEKHLLVPVSVAASQAQDNFAAGEQSNGNVAPTPFAVQGGDGLRWAVPNDDEPGTLTEGTPHGSFPLGLKVIRQAIGSKLLLQAPAMCQVNGVPALPIVVLQTKDLVGLPDGSLYAVTELITPHYGFALDEHVGQKCSLCKLPFDAGSFVVSCRCGALYHHETAETVPEMPSEDRCACGADIKACLVCGLPISTEPFLSWDPSDLR